MSRGLKRSERSRHFLTRTTGACSASRILEKKLRTSLYLSTATVPLFIVSERLKSNLPSFTSYDVEYLPNEVSSLTGSGSSSTANPCGRLKITFSLNELESRTTGYLRVFSVK